MAICRLVVLLIGTKINEAPKHDPYLRCPASTGCDATDMPYKVQNGAVCNQCYMLAMLLGS